MSASREKKQRKLQAENQVQTPVDNSAARKSKRNKIIGTVAGIVIALVVAAVIIVYSLSKTSFYQTRGTALEVGGEKLSPAEFSYYYWDSYYSFASQYSSLLQYLINTSLPLEDQECTFDSTKTWAEYFIDSGIAYAESSYTLYNAAKADGFTLNEEQQAQLDTEMENLRANVGGTDKAVKSYLAQYYGTGCTLESYREYQTVQLIASAYAQQKNESFTFTQDEMDAYYAEHISEFDTVNFRLFSLPYDEDGEEVDPEDGKLHLTQDEAKSIIDTMAETCKGDEQAFLDMAWENIAPASKETMEDADSFTKQENVTAATLPNEEVTAWLYDESRVEGDTYVNEIDGGYSIYFFISRQAVDYDTVNYRNILIPPQVANEVKEQDEANTETSSEVTEADWNIALTAAQALVTKWQDELGGDEDGFAEAAAQFSSDASNYENGGLNENVSKTGLSEEMVDWLFDETRAEGDYAIIQTTDGYQVVYFVGYGENYQDQQVRLSMQNNSYNEWYESIALTAKRGSAMKHLETTHYASAS